MHIWTETSPDACGGPATRYCDWPPNATNSGASRHEASIFELALPYAHPPDPWHANLPPDKTVATPPRQQYTSGRLSHLTRAMTRQEILHELLQEAAFMCPYMRRRGHAPPRKAATGKVHVQMILTVCIEMHVFSPPSEHKSDIPQRHPQRRFSTATLRVLLQGAGTQRTCRCRLRSRAPPWHGANT